MFVVALSLCVVFGSVFGYFLLRQNGRLLLRLDAIERELLLARLSPHAGDVGDLNEVTNAATDRREEGAHTLSSRMNRKGLPMGTPAPTFSVRRLDAPGLLSLDTVTRRPCLLVFVSSTCTPCDGLLRQLGSLPSDWISATTLVVAKGSPEAVIDKLARGAVKCAVGLQEAWEVSRLYEIFTLPCAFAVDINGRTIGPPAVGMPAVAQLATELYARFQDSRGVSIDESRQGGVNHAIANDRFPRAEVL